MASCTSQASLKTWTRPQSSKTRHLTHWEITHHSTCSITEAEFSSALQNKSHPLQTPRPCPPIPCGYASWKTFIKTGLQWAALPVILFFFSLVNLFVSSSVGRKGKSASFPVFMYMWICCTNMHLLWLLLCQWTVPTPFSSWYVCKYLLLLWSLKSIGYSRRTQQGTNAIMYIVGLAHFWLNWT